MSNLVRYGSYSIEQVNEDSAKANSISGKAIMDLEVGSNIVRFIPPKVGRVSPLRVTAMHYVDAVPGLDKTLVFACPRHELREQCPVCMRAEQLSRSPNPHDREMAFKISAQLRVYAPVLDRSVKDAQDAIKILAFGKQIHNGLKNIRKNPRLGGDFTDPTENGFDVIIEREGTGMKTAYTVNADRQSSPLAPTAELINWVIENQPDPEALVNPVVPQVLLDAWELTTLRKPAGPSRDSGQRVGAGVVRSAQARSAVDDARQVVEADGVEYDDDFNPIVR